MFSPLIRKLKCLVNGREVSILERAKISPPLSNVIVQTYPMASYSISEMKDYVYDLVRTIADPEKPYNLEELNIVYETGIEVTKSEDDSVFRIRVEFTPTVAHCSLATLIGLCIRVKLNRNILAQHKLTIRLKEGTHVTEDAVNKQINDKERVAAAMEHPSLQQLVQKCTEEVY